MFAHYLHTMIEWAQGELDAGEFRAATLLGMALMLLGVARGRAARQLERRAQELQTESVAAAKPGADETRLSPRREARRRPR
jgi:hypothetical protein